jgi:hypothetical protein
MKKVSVLLVALLFLYGCSHICAKNDKNKEMECSKIETILSDFSKKIIAYYDKKNIPIPKDFDEKQIIEVLEKEYPDQTKVKLIKSNFKIKARSIDNSYSVVLCEPNTGNKLMEDLGCHTTHVELRFWDKESTYPCTFEENWGSYCR